MSAWKVKSFFFFALPLIRLWLESSSVFSGRKAEIFKLKKGRRFVGDTYAPAWPFFVSVRDCVPFCVGIFLRRPVVLEEASDPLCLPWLFEAPTHKSVLMGQSLQWHSMGLDKDRNKQFIVVTPAGEHVPIQAKILCNKTTILWQLELFPTISFSTSLQFTTLIFGGN